jgi:hypothetical protein
MIGGVMMTDKIVPFLNLFNGYTCPICKSGVDEYEQLCWCCHIGIDWGSVEKPDYNKKYNAVNHCPDIHD